MILTIESRFVFCFFFRAKREDNADNNNNNKKKDSRSKSKSRRRATLVLTMAGTAVLFFALIATGIYCSSGLETKELLLVHVISRHGARTPVDTYPKDPYINTTFHPVGWGQLTNEGKRELYRLGKDLRRRYDDFLGESYSQKLYHCQSTDVDRTIASVQVINAGLWEPKGDQRWGGLNWQPIPVHYEQLNEDKLLLVRKTCPQYEIEFRKIFSSEPVQEKLHENHELIRYLEDHSGNPIRNFDDVQDLYSTLYAEESFNFTLPSWTIDVYPEKIYELTAFSFHLRAYNDLLTRLKGGVLLKKIISDWLEMKDGGDSVTNQRKFYLYAGHDSTIANLLSALRVFKPHVPDYASTIILEFSRDRITMEYGVEVFYRMSIQDPLMSMQLPACEMFCTLDKFLKITEDLVPDDWEGECATDDPNFVPGEPVGP